MRKTLTVHMDIARKRWAEQDLIIQTVCSEDMRAKEVLTQDGIDLAEMLNKSLPYLTLRAMIDRLQEYDWG